MDTKYLPTKSNFIKLKSRLRFSIQGTKLLERKKIILTKELEKYQLEKNEIEKQLILKLKEGKECIKRANIDIGIDNLIDISNGVKVDEYIDIKYITNMGVELPSIVHNKEVVKLDYGFYNTTNMVDESIISFNEIQRIIIDKAITDKIIYKIKEEIEKVQKRANALKNIIIPVDEENLKNIQNVLEERDREEFARLKVIKSKKGKNLC